jgi:hypothetical protein
VCNRCETQPSADGTARGGQLNLVAPAASNVTDADDRGVRRRRLAADRPRLPSAPIPSRRVGRGRRLARGERRIRPSAASAGASMGPLIRAAPTRRRVLVTSPDRTPRVYPGPAVNPRSVTQTPTLRIADPRIVLAGCTGLRRLRATAEPTPPLSQHPRVVFCGGQANGSGGGAASRWARKSPLRAPCYLREFPFRSRVGDQRNAPAIESQLEVVIRAGVFEPDFANDGCFGFLEHLPSHLNFYSQLLDAETGRSAQVAPLFSSTTWRGGVKLLISRARNFFRKILSMRFFPFYATVTGWCLHWYLSVA